MNSKEINTNHRFYKMDSLIERYTETGNANELTMAVNLNTAISPSDNIETHQKTFNSIYHTYLIADSLVSTSQLNALKSLAQLCPFTEGTNVYQARALLRRYDTTEYYNICELTIPDFINNSNRIMNTVSEAKNDKELFLLVFPNPANNEITITSNLSDGELILYSLLGVEITRVKLKGHDKLNISELPSGVYLYKVMKDGSNIKSERIIINH